MRYKRFEVPPKAKTNRQQIIDTAFEMVRENGVESLNARNLARRIGCSTQPLFYNFSTMEELLASVIYKANEFYHSYIWQAMSEAKYPPYKASGMAYIQFAKDERNLFNLLFMRDRTNEKVDVQNANFEEIVSMLMTNYGLSHDEAQFFHLEMWAVVHGIAAMQATSFLNLDADMASTCLTNVFEGLKLRLELRKKEQEKGE